MYDLLITHSAAGSELEKPAQGARRTFWVDFENLYCIAFFHRIIRRLNECGHKVFVTYRNFPGMEQLLPTYGISGKRIGRYGGRHRIAKIILGVHRSILLALWANRRNIDLAVSFGSRTQILCCGLKRIPCATVLDYEHVSTAVIDRFCTWIFVPEDVANEHWRRRGIGFAKLVKFKGLKESVHVSGCIPNNHLTEGLGIDPKKIIAVIRPPARIAHYHDNRSEKIFEQLLQGIGEQDAVVGIVIPRAGDVTYKKFLAYKNIISLPIGLNGAEIVWLADLVVSGGGTMTREAAALGIPAYSIFTGRVGAVDARLAAERRLVLIRRTEDLNKIVFRKRDRNARSAEPSLLEFFVGEFVRRANTQHQLREC